MGERIEPVLLGVAAKCLRVAPETIDPHAPLTRYGLDSLTALELCVALTEAIGVDVGEDDLLDAPSIHALAQRLMAIDMKPLPRGARFERMLADTHLPADVDPRGLPASAGAAVMLTGATGFLGVHVLAALAATGASTLVCPVRARDDRHALDRIHATMSRYGVRMPELRARVIAVAADLEDPHLGRPVQEYEQLAHAVADVVHCAADVDWALPYEGLRAANVLVTQNLLRFASSGASKRFHFVSSLAARYSTCARYPIAENGTPDLAGIHLGYAQSKWVAERLVEACCNRGLDATMVRPSLISGDSRSGIGNDDDLLAQLIRGVIALGHAPDLDWRLDACPVDYVAQAIAGVVREPQHGVRGLHLRNPKPARWSEAVLWMNVRGYRVGLEPFAAWIERAERASRDPRHVLHRLRGFLLTRPQGEGGRTLPEIYADPTVACVDAERSDALVQRLGMRCPRMSARLLERCFDTWIAHGTLPSPPSRRLVRPSGTIDDDQLARQLQEHFADPHLRIAASRMRDFGFEHSILGELAALQAGHAFSMQARSLELRSGDDRCLTLEIVVKPKFPDATVLGVATEVAALCSEALGAAFAAHRAATGLVGNARRELGVYRGAKGALRDTLPVCYGVVEGDGSGVLLLERVGERAAPHCIDQGTWTSARIETALHAIGRIHGEWLDREEEVEALLGGAFGVGAAVGAAPLWRALSDYARPRLRGWIGVAGARLQSGLSDAAHVWLTAHADCPRTLAHNDFNPRNFILAEDGSLRAFDWELAEFGLPQRDVIEMLCFVLPPDASARDVERLVGYHREVVESVAAVALDCDQWCRGVRLALADFGVRRLPMYVMADRIRPQPFLERVSRTWMRLGQIFGLETLRPVIPARAASVAST